MKNIFLGMVLALGVVAACQKGQASSSGVPPVQPAPPAQVPPKPLILWDGESQASGVGWVSPTDSTMYAGVEDSIVHSGHAAIVIHMAHAGAFLESGWQWSTWADTKSTDLSPYDTLKLSIRVDGPRLPPDLNLSLASPGDHHTTQRLSLLHYDGGLMDHAWHDLAIPLKDFYTQGMPFDPQHAIQLIIGTWNDTGDFTFYLDDITVVH
jgi:hypothetical protein